MDLDKIMQNQPTINIGTIGHVAHGKSTLVNAISSIKTVRFKSEMEKNITIKLGYANTKIFQCDSPECPRPDCYQSYKTSAKTDLKCKREGCSGTLKLVKHVSFVDCPGHDVLMTTMINGTAVMDAAILMIAANEPCPQQQTVEHLFALEKTDLSKIIVVQNKIDLISREKCLEQQEKIDEFLKNTKAEDSPIIPVSGQYKLNINAVLDYIVNYIPNNSRLLDVNPRLVIIRSFDINKPGYKIDELVGGVIGGSLLFGKLKLGDEIEIRPGIIMKAGKNFKIKPFISKIISLKTENVSLNEAYPGGLIAIGTDIDPSCCIADNLVGHILGLKGDVPDIYQKLTINYEIFDTFLDKKDKEIKCLVLNEVYMLNVGSCSLNAMLKIKTSDHLTFDLFKPVCCDLREKVTLSKKVSNNWRLIGYGKIVEGEILEPDYEMDFMSLRELGYELATNKM